MSSPQEQEALAPEEHSGESILSPEELARLDRAGSVSADALVSLMSGRQLATLGDDIDPRIASETAQSMMGLSLGIMQFNLDTVRGDVDEAGKNALDRFGASLSGKITEVLAKRAERAAEAKKAAIARADAARIELQDPAVQANPVSKRLAERDIENLKYTIPVEAKFSVDRRLDDRTSDNALIADAAWEAARPDEDAPDEDTASDRANRVFEALLSLVPEKSNIVIDYSTGSFNYFRPSDPYDKPSQSVDLK